MWDPSFSGDEDVEEVAHGRGHLQEVVLVGLVGEHLRHPPPVVAGRLDSIHPLLQRDRATADHHVAVHALIGHVVLAVEIETVRDVYRLDQLLGGGGDLFKGVTRGPVMPRVERDAHVRAIRALDDLERLDVVAAVVREVTGVQAQVRVAWVGLVEEAVHFARRADVAVGVRVELLVNAELLEQRLAEAVVTRRELLPLLIAEGARLEHLARRVRAPQVGDHDEVLGAELRGEARDRECLVPRALPLVVALVEAREHRSGRELEPTRT
ncbi:hypothetical protein FF38_07166, partial [Lucilia cuprina]